MNRKSLAERLHMPHAAPEGLEAGRRFDSLLREADHPDLAALASGRTVRAVLKSVAGASPYLFELCRSNPKRLVRLLQGAPDVRLQEALANCAAACREAPTMGEAMTALRDLKQEAALLIGLCDLGGIWDLTAVTGALTRIADQATSLALQWLLREAARQGRFALASDEEPEVECGTVALAMGKHGAHELNYSSDIDLIILYDPETRRLADGLEPGPFFVRLTQNLVRMLSERTSDGYVFRVDLRLRPDPGSTAVAIALPAAFAYYETAGQNWERAAMIKARPVAGDIALGEAFLADLRPFIWRRHLDFAAIADIHAMKRQIQIHKGHQSVAVAGHDLKLGRGGIREIEFFVQTQQLIAGGRHAALRGRGTVDMLAALAAGGWISNAARDDLTSAYRFLRTLEHRLQMVADEQTHTIPPVGPALSRFARFAGYRDVAALETAVTEVLLRVQGHYAELFEAAPQLSSPAGSLVFTGKGDDPETLETLSRLGYAQPATVAETVRGWHFGRYVAMRSPRAREDLTALTPSLLEALARVGRPDETLRSFDRMLSHMPAGFQFFSMLRANAGLLQIVARILGVAPRLADIVAARPHALDGLLDPAVASVSTSVADVERRLARSVGLARGYEDGLDRARIFVREQIFLIGARVIAGDTPIAAAALQFAALAEACMRVMLKVATADLARVHGVIPKGRVVVLGMGKLGGREMTAASDLDLIILYDHPAGVLQSNGEKPLSPSTWYARLTQRLFAALTAPTAEGILYPVDLRLRPSGRKGPVAVHMDAFGAYQAEEAWTWEHMALTRARVVAGDEKLRRKAERVIAGVLQRRRDRDTIIRDVAEMRALIAQEKGGGNRWDIKLATGGLLDIEFIVQTLQLLHASEVPSILATHTGEAIPKLATAGFLSPEDAEALQRAHGLYTAVTQILRLCMDNAFDPGEASAGFKALIAHAADQPDFRRLEATVTATEDEVRGIVKRLFS